MLNNIKFDTLTTTIRNAWNTAKNYVNPTSDEIKQIEQNWSSEKQKTYQHVDFKRLLAFATLSLFNATKNQTVINLGLVTLFAESVDAAYPTIANPIPTQYAQPGQSFSYDIDLNYVFNDADGDIMTFGGIAMTDGGPLPSWLTTSPMKLSGRDYVASTADVEVVGQIAYTIYRSILQDGLAVFNVSEPANKILLADYTTLLSPRDMVVANDIVYVADYTAGLKLFDVSNPNKINLLNTYNSAPGRASNLFFLNNVIYLTDDIFRLHIINTSNPYNLSVVSIYNTTTTEVKEIFVLNNIAYLAHSSALELVDVSDVNNPSLLNTFSPISNTYGLFVKPGIAYLTKNTATPGLQLLDVTNPGNITLITTYNADGIIGPAYKVVVVNNKAYVAHLNNIQILDVTNPRNVTYLGNCSVSNTERVQVQNNIVYIADKNSGLLFANVSNPTMPFLIGNYDTLGTDSLFVQDNVAYVTYLSDGIRLINVSNPAKQAIISTYPTIGANAIDVVDNIAYVSGVFISGNYNLQILNVSDVNNPTLLGNCLTPGGHTYDVIVINKIAYLAVDSSFRIYNVSDPQNCTLIGSYNTTNAEQLFIENGIAYVAGSKLYILDVNNLSNPILLSDYGLGFGSNVRVINDLAYIGKSLASGFDIVNISNTRNLTLIGEYSNGRVYSPISVLNGIACTPDYYNGVQFVDITNPVLPRLVGNYDTLGYVYELSIVNNTLYIADSDYGLQIVDMTKVKFKGEVPAITPANYTFNVTATNINGEMISTQMRLIIIPKNVTPLATNTLYNPSMSIVPSSSIISNTDSLSTATSTTTFQNSDSITFSIYVSSTPIAIETDANTILTSQYLSVSGNVDASQIVYTVQGNHPDIVIIVNGIETNQFTQADVEGNFVELALQGVTCGDYSTDLQLEANVAGSNAPAQQVSVGLIFEGTTCSNAEKPSPFSFRDAHIGFWSQKREVEQEIRSVQSHNYIPTFKY